MRGSYKLLSIILGVCWSALFILQATTPVFTAGPERATGRQEHRAKSMTPAATTPTIITGGQGGANKVPDPTQDCLSGITSPPADVLKLLAPGWTSNDLGEQYRDEKKHTLCYDGFKSEWAAPGGTWLKITDFLTAMRWPSDLFNLSPDTQLLIVQRPNDALKPSKETTPQNTKQEATDKCVWNVDLGVIHPSINICELMSTILKAALLAPLKFGVDNLAGDTNSFLWTTPPHLSYGNPDLALFWNTSLSIVNALLAVVLAWAGLRYMMGKSFGSWLSYADLLEMLPRIILALIAAYVSARICQVVIDGSNVLSSIFQMDLLSSLKNEPGNLFTTFVQIFLAGLLLLLILEEAVRFAILFVLIGFSPIWAFCGALRETQFIFKGALKALFFMSLLQSSQIAVMSLGQHLTTSIGGKPDSLLYSFVNVALMLLVLFMLSAFLRASGLSMPFGLVGAAGLALGARAIGRGISHTVRGGAKTIKNSPRIASTVIHAPGRAYRAARAAPTQIKTRISTAQAQMSKAYKTMTTVGKWLANPPGTGGRAKP